MSFLELPLSLQIPIALMIVVTFAYLGLLIKLIYNTFTD